MKKFLTAILLVLAGCQTRLDLTLREYQTPSFTLTYLAPSRVDPVFTFVARAPHDREDGAVYITADPPGGIFGTKPGRGFSVFVLPKDRFTSGALSETSLAEMLPSKQALNHPEETFEAQTEQIAGRVWTVLTARKKNADRDITGVSFYSRADNESLIYVAWTYPAASRDMFESEASVRRSFLESIQVTMRR